MPMYEKGLKMQYKMDLSEFSFNKIKVGRKIDMRLFDKKRQNLKIGDVIEYENIKQLRRKKYEKTITNYKK